VPKRLGAAFGKAQVRQLLLDWPQRLEAEEEQAGRTTAASVAVAEAAVASAIAAWPAVGFHPAKGCPVGFHPALKGCLWAVLCCCHLESSEPRRRQPSGSVLVHWEGELHMAVHTVELPAAHAEELLAAHAVELLAAHAAELVAANAEEFLALVAMEFVQEQLVAAWLPSEDLKQPLPPPDVVVDSSVCACQA